MENAGLFRRGGIFFCIKGRLYRIAELRAFKAFPWRGRWHPASPASRMTDEVAALRLVRRRSEAAGSTSSVTARPDTRRDSFPSRGSHFAPSPTEYAFKKIKAFIPKGTKAKLPRYHPRSAQGRTHTLNARTRRGLAGAPGRTKRPPFQGLSAAGPRSLQKALRAIFPFIAIAKLNLSYLTKDCKCFLSKKHADSPHRKRALRGTTPINSVGADALDRPKRRHNRNVSIKVKTSDHP